jgi:hypothetical protein
LLLFWKAIVYVIIVKKILLKVVSKEILPILAKDYPPILTVSPLIRTLRRRKVNDFLLNKSKIRNK